MIRTLVMIAIAGFVLSIAAFAAAVAIGGPEAITRGVWAWGGHRWADGDWDWDWDGDHGRHGYRADLGPQVTRELAWSGGDELDVDIPADVTYTQAAGPAKVVVTGPQRAVEAVEVDGGHIRMTSHRHFHRGRITITMTAPDVKRFDLSGSGRLAINDYRQDSLAIDLSGSGDIMARGQAREVTLDINGSGDANLGQLAAEGARVEISGSGTAIIAPTQRAKLEVSGSGDITLLTSPPKLESDVSGSGRVRQGSAAASSSETPTPSPSPSTTPAPAPVGKKL